MLLFLVILLKLYLNDDKKMKKQITPLLSIFCLTYNHEHYIKNALDGFTSQQTNFCFDIYIHDDCSLDNTVQIIKEYKKKNNHINLLCEAENQYVKGGNIWSRFPIVKSKYIAICEGDDYWTDPLKLQRQVDFLETHAEYSMSTENGLVINASGCMYNFSNNDTKDVIMKELLYQRQFPTASVVMRNKYFREILNFDFPVFDTFIWTYMSQKGKIHYRNIISSVYRRIDGVTERDKIKWAYLVESFNRNLYSKLDVPKEIIKERNKTQVLDCYFGYKEAKQQKQYRIACDLLCKCFSYDTRFFLKYWYTNSRFMQWIDTVKRSTKKIIKKLLKR